MKHNILIVDDEEDLRTLLTQFLRAKDFTVYQARSAEAALHLLQDNALSVDLVLTDLVMPGIHGDALAHEIRKLRPYLPILLATGYLDVPNLPPRTRTVYKPFAMQDLAAVIDEMLGQQSLEQTG